jgi:hypothetical protein
MERRESSSPENQPTLLSLNAEYQNVLFEITEAGGELTTETEARLDATVLALCQKADAYGIVSDRLKHEAAFWKAQKDKCAHAQKVFENALERLKERMKFVLKALPGEALEGQLYRFSLKKGQPKIEINMELLPKELQFTETTIVTKPSMDKIEALLKEGKTVPGVTVTETKALMPGRPK